MTRSSRRFRFTLDDRGFSLVELLVVLCIIGVVGAMAIPQVQNALAMARADSVSSRVASLLRYGRDAAVAQRRTVDVQFIQPNRLILIRNDRPTGTTQIGEAWLENGASFFIGAGVADTPEGFGNGSAISFGGSNTIRFQPDGMLTDGASIPLNGTVYVALPNMAFGQRAITVTGTTGRAQPYRWTGTRWETQ